MHKKSILNITGGQNKAKVPKGNQVQIFKNSIFWVPMHTKSILDIMGGQNQAKDIKGHQVQIFKKCIFELLLQCIENGL